MSTHPKQIILDELTRHEVPLDISNLITGFLGECTKRSDGAYEIDDSESISIYATEPFTITKATTIPKNTATILGKEISLGDDMSYRFANCTMFNGDISKWDTSAVKNMCYMFKGATAFKGDISKWDTSAVKSMRYTFSGATAFNGDLSKWDTSAVGSMRYMFYGATAFNGEISKWDTSAVGYMDSMFEGATAFNGDISKWDTSAVID
jgi:surface protein